MLNLDEVVVLVAVALDELGADEAEVVLLETGRLVVVVLLLVDMEELGVNDGVAVEVVLRVVDVEELGVDWEVEVLVPVLLENVELVLEMVVEEAVLELEDEVVVLQPV